MSSQTRSVPTEEVLPKTIRSSSLGLGFQGVRTIVRELPSSGVVELPGGHDAFWLGYRPAKEPGRMVFRVDDPVSPEHVAEHNPVFLSPRAPVRTEWRDAEGVVANFSFHPEFLSSIARLLHFDARVLDQRPACKIILDDSLESLCYLLMSEVEQGCRAGSVFVEHVGRALAIAVVKHLTTELTAIDRSRLDPRIERARQFIEERFKTRVTLDDIEQVARLSRFHLLRMFRSGLGVTPHQHLVRCRLRYAQQLIRTEGNTRTLQDIATEAGFSDGTQMTRHFRRVFGKTPAQYFRQQ
jgi:AraC-like DNA-binding protein